MKIKAYINNVKPWSFKWPHEALLHELPHSENFKLCNTIWTLGGDTREEREEHLRKNNYGFFERKK